MTNLTDPIYNDEEAARAYFEGIRWPSGRVCPHCGTVDNSVLLKGKSTRPGVYKCRDCRKPFSATIGTVYERSHIPLHKWLLATHLMVSSKKGISAHQLYRSLGFGSYRTAWFMAMRIREAMREGDLEPMGGEGSIVEVDETFIGSIKPKAKAFHHKMKVLSLVERGGKSRSIVVQGIGMATLVPIVRANLDRETHVMTDEGTAYRYLKHYFFDHSQVKHRAGEYARGNVSTNTVEGFFSIFKRGMRGVYQHCREHHLHRYLAEFDFRYTYREACGTNDAQRAVKAVQGTIGKRLMLKGFEAAAAI
jgi:transposase-like protein